jgi:16S rRNA (guanine1207-N2)-methyltransferase
MFSPGRLDPGTRFLLEEAPRPPATGDLLDLGCGYGPIACTLASRAPGATVWAVDVNERALALCAANAAAAGLANVRCVTPDAAEIPATFAGIWSNPPVRIGKPALHELLRTWLARLSPGTGSAGGAGADSAGAGGAGAGGASADSAGADTAGAGGASADSADSAGATLVVGRNLGADSLHAWLEKEEGWLVRRLAARSGYRLLHISFPSPPSRHPLPVISNVGTDSP